MKIVALAALEFEIEPIVKTFHLKKIKSFGYTKTWQGNEFELVQTNVGKVHAAAVTQLVIDNITPDWIINVGVCGGFEKAVQIGDVIMPDRVIQYDIDQTKIGYPLGRIHHIEKIALPLKTFSLPKSLWSTGLCLTADKFLSEKNEGKTLVDLFHPSIVDMELGSIAQVCYLNQVKLAALKSPVDIVEKVEGSNFKTRINLAMDQINHSLKKLNPLLQ